MILSLSNCIWLNQNHVQRECQVLREEELQSIVVLIDRARNFFIGFKGIMIVALPRA